jgi:hypothetical protein
VAATVFSKKYPPRNRKLADRLFPITSEVVGEAGTFQLDPNRCIMLAASRELPFGDPLETRSVLSERPGYIYRTAEIELVLAPRELIRFWLTSLRPEEFLALRDMFGIFYEIHDDFYDEETGTAWQARLSDDDI